MMCSTKDPLGERFLITSKFVFLKALLAPSRFVPDSLVFQVGIRKRRVTGPSRPSHCLGHFWMLPGSWGWQGASWQSDTFQLREAFLGEERRLVRVEVWERWVRGVKAPQGLPHLLPGSLTCSHTKKNEPFRVNVDANFRGLYVGDSWKNVEEMDCCCCYCPDTYLMATIRCQATSMCVMSVTFTNMHTSMKSN